MAPYTHYPQDLPDGDFTVSVLGPGTGLGTVGLLRRNGLLYPVVGEAGHVGFAPETQVQIDILRALEPKYDDLEQPPYRLHTGFSREFMKSLMDRHQLWQAALQDICSRAAERNVKTFMVTPTEGEFVDENASLEEAIHQLVMGHHQSILVLRKKKIVGILRLTDVFETVSNIIRQCPV